MKVLENLDVQFRTILWALMNIEQSNKMSQKTNIQIVNIVASNYQIFPDNENPKKGESSFISILHQKYLVSLDVS